MLLSFSNKQPPVKKAKNMSCFIWLLNTGLTVCVSGHLEFKLIFSEVEDVVLL